MGAHVVVRGLSRRFEGAPRAAVAHLDFEVPPGETLCIVGPSGCGKSTTLRMVAGLEHADGGEILIDGRDMRGVEPQARDVAMVFQGFALYPHMTVRENLSFPLEMRRIPQKERRETIERTAEMLSITGLLQRRPPELSGGERQRVAMGRAVVRRPKVFLFDEPLSNLDAALRAELRIELGQLLARLEATALYVTHDQTEAMTLGHRIALMRDGRLEQLDVPRAMYERPTTAFGARFFGSPPMNLVEVTVQDGVARSGDLEVPAPHVGPAGRLLGVRPEHVVIGAADDGGAAATVVGVEPHGAESHVELRGGTWAMKARVVGFSTLERGAAVRVRIPAERVRWFDAASGQAL